MGVTTDSNDPRLGHGASDGPVPQNEVHLVLSKEERDKGFVRPLRTSYKHVGLMPPMNLRDLTDEERERYGQYNYVKYEKYYDDSEALGRFWTQERLDRVAGGCGTVTTMGLELAETYARAPYFYGSTYCCGCREYRLIEEFIWLDGKRVGS